MSTMVIARKSMCREFDLFNSYYIFPLNFSSSSDRNQMRHATSCGKKVAASSRCCQRNELILDWMNEMSGALHLRAREVLGGTSFPRRLTWCHWGFSFPSCHRVTYRWISPFCPSHMWRWSMFSLCPLYVVLSVIDGIYHIVWSRSLVGHFHSLGDRLHYI